METNSKKCKVIMLPTNEPPKQGDIMFWKGDNGGIRPKYYGVNKDGSGFHGYSYLKPQHLYITSDDEIKEGDWYYVPYSKVVQWASPTFLAGNTNNCFKIIATTDKSLKVLKKYSEEEGIAELLPQPSKAFIEKYCKEDGIDEVMVEYEANEDDLKYYNEQVDYYGYCDAEVQYEPKVNSHNEITIHPIKNSWNKEEVEELCKSAFEAGDNFRLYLDKQAIGIVTEGLPNVKTIMETMNFNNWIKDNL